MSVREGAKESGALYFYICALQWEGKVYVDVDVCVQRFCEAAVVAVCARGER